jgi:predicted ester cyclase
VSAYDPVLTTYGDILVPHKYHVRIRRAGYVVWQGAIIDNTKRNKSYIEVMAAEYEFYLDKILIARTSPDANGTANIYRNFASGTMATAVTALLNETITTWSNSVHVLKNMTIGTIDNPSYPPNMVSDYNGTALSGPWTFGDGSQANPGPQLQYDFHTLLYVLKSFGIYSYADFQITPTLQFNFRSFLGNNLLAKLVFQFGKQGNIYDYNLPRLGKRQANSLLTIATDPNGVILHVEPTDQTSITSNGLMEAVAAYSDVKSQSTLNARANAELPLVSTADETNAIVYLNENGYPLGQYDVGDIVTIKVQNLGVNFNSIRRIVGYTVMLNETGRESIALQTNVPLPWQYSTVS